MLNPIEPKELKDIAIWMTSNIPTELPSVLKGVFFMDGNPLPDSCLTLYNLEWDAQTYSLKVPVADPLQWTFHRNFQGLLLLRLAQISRFTYKLQFEDATIQRSQIIPFLLGIPVPTWVVYLTMEREANSNGDVWHRKNVWFGGVPRIGEYVMRRVVDETGQYTPAFDDMLKKAPNQCWVVAETTK
jgi:hypothetical protein